MLQISKPIHRHRLQQCHHCPVLLRYTTMHHLLLAAALAAFPLGGMAGPANGAAAPVQPQGRELLPEGARAEQSKDQRRAALRQALVQRQEAVPARPDGAPARQLSPSERAELRRQLRDQSAP